MNSVGAKTECYLSLCCQLLVLCWVTSIYSLLNEQRIENHRLLEVIACLAPSCLIPSKHCRSSTHIPLALFLSFFCTSPLTSSMTWTFLFFESLLLDYWKCLWVYSFVKGLPYRKVNGSLAIQLLICGFRSPGSQKRDAFFKGHSKNSIYNKGMTDNCLFKTSCDSRKEKSFYTSRDNWPWTS